MKRRKKSKRVRNILLAVGGVFTLLLAISVGMLMGELRAYRQGVQTYEALAQHVVFPPAAPPPVGEVPQPNLPTLPGGEIDPEPEETGPRVNFPVVDFAALAEINPNIVGWLVLEGTPINYPVVHWSDNDRYLHHLFDGTRNAAGTLFVDHRNARRFMDSHTIIHGHNMRDGSMFAILESYRSQAFFDAHPELLLVTPEQNFIIQLFAGYMAHETAGNWQIDFPSFSDFDEWVRGQRALSDFTSDVEASGLDRIITLSTCSTSNRSARYVVIGKLVPVE